MVCLKRVLKVLSPDRSSCVREEALDSAVMPWGLQSQQAPRKLSHSGMHLGTRGVHESPCPEQRIDVFCCLQLARLDHKEASGKALYALSSFLHNENFRRRFFEEGGLAMLQRLLAGQDTPSNVHRKALALLADLAHYQVPSSLMLDTRYEFNPLRAPCSL